MQVLQQKIGTEALNEWLREQKRKVEEKYFKVTDLEGGEWFHISRKFIEKMAPKIGARGVAIYCVLKYFANRNGNCYPSIGKIAKILNCCNRTVIRYLKKLEIVGAVKVERREGEVNHYYLVKIE